MRSLVRLRSLALSIALVATTAACTSHAVDRQDDESPVLVRIGRVETIEWPVSIEAGGVLRGRLTAEISSRILAPVSVVHVRAGDRVRRGQPLIELDAAELQAQASRGTSSLRAADLGARAAAADSAGAEAALALARSTHARIRRLHEQRSATDQELDEAAGALAAAEARVTAVRAQANAARAALEAAQAAARAGDIVAGYRTLTAPFDGIVINRRIDPGAMAAPGATLLTIEDPGALRLHAQLDATRAAAIRPGAPAEIRIDSDGADAGWFAGRVVEIARVDPASQTFEIRIDPVAPPPAGWQSGLFGRARVRTGSRSALTAPAASIIRRGQLTLTFVVSADERARLRAVRVGEAFDDRVEILAGLADGDRLVIDPPVRLADGAPVFTGGGQ
jgi:RND family efflux transporter MFP subunit